MWEEQLGLTGDSMKRFKNCLKDFKNWKNHSDDLKYTYYYNPESNYHILGEIELSPLERKEEPFSLFYLDDNWRT